jgi:hypothetical protein
VREKGSKGCRKFPDGTANCFAFEMNRLSKFRVAFQIVQNGMQQISPTVTKFYQTKVAAILLRDLKKIVWGQGHSSVLSTCPACRSVCVYVCGGVLSTGGGGEKEKKGSIASQPLANCGDVITPQL